ncbi:MAG TPA: phosphoribosylamine--glycine ligase [Pyrinomonadaceae bacterium]|jgi:phosphoribosylamine--glycine ligase|nr:phosphoribosylamine--glycine ligase [Pyrinomonadaceae bacterium]
MSKSLIIGSGGREHAIAWALRHTSTNPTEIFCVPGNAGIAQIAHVANISLDDFASVAEFAESQQVDLTFVGPEAPLAAGIVDFFNDRGLRIVGPTAAAARLEGSKIFAKDFMARHQIPTAAYRVAESPQEAVEHLKSGEFGSPQSPIVIKADGLAAGKGVVVAANHAEAEKAIADLMVHHVAGAEAAQRIVLEEALAGTEASLLIFSDGRDYGLMPAARDHKRIGENDTGPNTGGMGTITDPSVLEKRIEERVVHEIVKPTLAGARDEGFEFKGVLFLGLMLTEDGPKLLEYNVRFGDPETQAILVRLKTDLLSIFEAMHNQTLGRLKVEWAEGSSACVVAANKGYPGKYEKGAVIEGLETIDPDAVQVFHAGTAKDANGRFIATGGRVLGVTAAAPNLSGALNVCYGSLAKIQWPGMQFRRDIGRRAASG